MAKSRKAQKPMEKSPQPPSCATDPDAEFWCDVCQDQHTVIKGACSNCGNRIFAWYDRTDDE